MLSETQRKNYDVFSKNLREYLQNPIMKGKYAVFCNEKLQGVYDSFEAAYSAACSEFPIGDFVIQQIIDSSEIVEFLWSAVVK